MGTKTVLTNGTQTRPKIRPKSTENQQMLATMRVVRRRHRKAACFEALVLEPNVSRRKEIHRSPMELVAQLGVPDCLRCFICAGPDD